MSLESIEHTLIPRLLECGVVSVTLTGGEPFAHPEVMPIIVALRRAGVRVSVCTNGTYLEEDWLGTMQSLGSVYVNVSLDGFQAESHGVFRGEKQSFEVTRTNIERLGRARLLKGLLVTPNALAANDEYVSLCEFAIALGAEYVLMNPLSNYGRGVKSQRLLASSDLAMNRIRSAVQPLEKHLDIAFIRFPNDLLPLSGCEAGNIIYIFADGALTVCPYLVFAAQTPQSLHDPQEFIVGNIFDDSDIAVRLRQFSLAERYDLGSNSLCGACHHESSCQKGCPAAVISSGQRIEGVDTEVCPVTSTSAIAISEIRVLPRRDYNGAQ